MCRIIFRPTRRRASAPSARAPRAERATPRNSPARGLSLTRDPLMLRKALLLPALLLLAPLCASAQAPRPAEGALPKGIARVTSVEGVTEYRLANGLRILMIPDRSIDTITVNVTYLVGSRHEGYGETGMAHLLEHLMFLRTKTRTDIKKELKDHGAEMNGSTSWDRTNYFETMTATDENLKFAIDLEADRMLNCKFDKAAFDKEMTVVRNEFEMGENSPQRTLMQRVLETAYSWHNYGK